MIMLTLKYRQSTLETGRYKCYTHPKVYKYAILCNQTTGHDLQITWLLFSQRSEGLSTSADSMHFLKQNSKEKLQHEWFFTLSIYARNNQFYRMKCLLNLLQVFYQFSVARQVCNNSFFFPRQGNKKTIEQSIFETSNL